MNNVMIIYLHIWLFEVTLLSGKGPRRKNGSGTDDVAMKESLDVPWYGWALASVGVALGFYILITKIRDCSKK